MQKSLQRKFWQIGAQKYLREEKGHLTSAWMLEHSLQDNPSDIWRGNDSRIAYLMNHDSAYLQELDKAIAEAENEKRDWMDNKKIMSPLTQEICIIRYIQILYILTDIEEKMESGLLMQE